MTSMPDPAPALNPVPAAISRAVAGGADTHKDLHVAAVIDHGGTVLATRSFPTTRAGYRALIRWMRSFGDVRRIGVEGTGSSGAGLTRQLAEAGIEVLEVDRPDRPDRRRKGKDDDLDAISAARAAPHRQRTSIPKAKDGAVESLRVPRVTRNTAIRGRRNALQLLRMSIVAAPEELRDQVRNLTKMQLIRTCAAWRPDPANAADPVSATRIALKPLARRILELGDEIAALDELIAPLVRALAPQLLQRTGIGIEIAGQLLVTAGDNRQRLRSEASRAMLCGAAPLPASSGQTQRHRLDRGGGRQANSALHLAAITRIRIDQRTQAYVAKKRAEGRSMREIIRCLKRHIAREVYYLLNPAARRRRQPAATAGARRRPASASPVPPPPPSPPERRPGQGAAPSRRNDLDRAEHRHIIIGGGTTENCLQAP
jgi:transposase